MHNAKRTQLKGLPSPIWINEDYPTEIRQRRSTLNTVVRHARSLGHRATLSADKCIINGRAYSTETLDQLPEELNPEKASTLTVSEDVVAFFSGRSPLSNFFKANMTIDGIQYSCNEQYFQHQKALECNNQDAANKILHTTNPAEMKRTGDRLRTPPSSRWNEKHRNVMSKGCFEKFKQNSRMKQVLLNTKDATLVEAGPDTFWGAGVRLHDPRLKHSQWTGQNELGKTLMYVRQALASGQQNI